MNEDRLYELIREKEQTAAVAFPALMRKVYVWMTLALLITGFTAYGVASSPGIISAIFANKMVVWGIFFAELGIVWYVSARIMRLSLMSATLLFVLYSVLNGLMLSFIFIVYTMTSIASVFFYNRRNVCRDVADRIFHQGRSFLIGAYPDDGSHRTHHRHAGKRVPA